MATTAPETTRPEEASSEVDEHPRILAIIVTHAGRRWLTDALVGLATQRYDQLDVLVVDDASPIEPGMSALKRVAKRHLRRKRWAYLRTPRPLGYGGAINWALSRIRVKADFLLFIHDDAKLEPDAVERMVERMLADETTAIVGPKIVAWDDPSRLEEVGMAADRFGYPYKGLEAGEIDLGQHDVSQEVFFVTSTCMLVRHEVFRQLRGWDARMRAFSEDLDLCWRARLAGHSVRVEPLAKARHAIAMARGERASKFVPSRYFIRRNRFRTVMKNAAGLRLLYLLPVLIFFTFFEMVGFLVLRQPREIVSLGRGLGWNFMTSVQTLAERRRVQKTRTISDRRLRRLTVRSSTRVRAYIGNQTERLEEAWGRRAETFASRRELVKGLGARTVGLAMLVLFLGLAGFLLGFRHFLWAPQAAIGELLPYPDRATALLRAWASPWQGVGLGQPGPAAPALGLLGLVPILTFGSVSAAQKILVLGLGTIAFIGAYHLISEVADRRARLVSGFAYAMGAVGYASMREGTLGAMVLGATAPFVLHSFIRLTGWVRPPGWNRSGAIARVALASAIAAAFVPGSLLLFAIVAVILAAFHAELGTARKSLTGLVSAMVGLVGGWALLLPWSLTWFSDGGPLALLWSSDTADTYAASFRNEGMASVVLGQTPQGPVLFGLALTILGVVAVLAGTGQRRRLALALWSVIGTVGLLIAATAAGILPPVASTPVEVGVLAALAFSGLAGLAAGAFRMDLPQRGFGWVHAATIVGLAVSCLLAVTGVVPALWRGEWAPGVGQGRENALVAAEIRSIFAADAQQVGQFRALWVGRKWSARDPRVSLSASDHFLTGPRGHVLSDLFFRNTGRGQESLERVIASVREGSTDRAGRLLGAFNVRYVVLERAGGVHRWLNQRDLALVRDQPDYILLQNEGELRRGALYNELPVYVRGLGQADPEVTSQQGEIERVSAEQRGASLYTAEHASGPGVIFLAETRDPGWQARVGDRSLEAIPGGWGNAFDVPRSVDGDLEIRYSRDIGDLVWLVVIPLMWVVVVGGAFSRKRERRTSRP
jgi:GT2 family glycosyltransferase